MSDKGVVFLCAFWHDWRVHFGVRVCDNIVNGVPSCVLAGFYPDVKLSLEHWLEGRRVCVEGDGVGVCRHFCRSDLSELRVKGECFFSEGMCVHSDVLGFGACVGCCRFVRSSF